MYSSTVTCHRSGQLCISYKAPGNLVLSCRPGSVKRCGRTTCFKVTQKIEHCSQDIEEATEGVCRMRQAKCTKNVLKLPCNVNRWHLLPRFHYISIQMSPDGTFQLRERLISSECSYKTTLAQSHGNVRTQPSRVVTAAYGGCSPAVSRCVWVF